MPDKKDLSPNHMTKTKSTTTNTLTKYRLYNAAVGALVLFQYMNDSEAEAKEYIPDMLIHFFEAIAPNSCTNFAIAANALRACQAGYGFFSGKSSIASAANLIDMGNHGFNIAKRMS